MAVITNYGTLKTAVADYLARSDLATFIPNFVQNAELKAYRRLRLRFMETSLSATISSGVIAVPSDYLEMKNLRVVSGGREYPLVRSTLEQLYEMYPLRTATGLPRVFAREGSNIIFGPYPDTTYTIKGIYYARPATFLYEGADGGTSWLTSNAADMMLYASLVEAEPFIKNDARLQVWQGFLANAVQTIQEQESLESLSGSSLAEEAL